MQCQADQVQFYCRGILEVLTISIVVLDKNISAFIFIGIYVN